MIFSALSVLETDEQRNELSEVYIKNSDKFYHIAYSKLQNRNDAEDAVEEAFLRVAVKPENFFGIPDEKKVAYLDVIIKNVAVEMFNKRCKTAAVDIEELYEEFTDTFPLPDELAIGEVAKDKLIDFIMSMPEGKRQAMLLKIEHQLTTKQIAAALGISESAARKRISDAEIMIRNYLDGELCYE